MQEGKNRSGLLPQVRQMLVEVKPEGVFEVLLGPFNRFRSGLYEGRNSSSTFFGIESFLVADPLRVGG